MALDPKTMLAGPSLEAWLDYARYHREQNHSPRTIQSAGEALAQLQDFLGKHAGGTCLLEANRHQVSDYLLWVGRTRSASTQLNRHRALSAFYRFCADEDILPASPMTRIAAPAADYKVPEVLADDQLAALLAACAAPKAAPAPARLAALRDAAMIRVFCEPGSPRASEMAGLDLADADMDADVITIRYGKNRRTRQIAMSPATARAVAKYRRARAASPRAAETGALWLGPKGRLTRFGIAQMLRRRGRQAALGPVHPHQLRHTAFADFDKATSGHTNAEMALFGWASPAMAHHYGRAVREAAALQVARELGRGNRLGRAS